ncbi:MAG: hypothetical protein ACRD09_02740 [Vicinamibacterales bacterium]
MLYILAIESDPRQAAALARVVKDRVGAKLTLVDSKDGAIASINKRVPDLILVSVLFSPRQEEELVAHLRTLEGADHLQTLTLPLLAAPEDWEGRTKRGLFGFRKKTDEGEMQGCDPYVFAEQIAVYLKTAAELKANAEAARLHAARLAMPLPSAPEPQLDTPDPVAETTSDAPLSPAPERPLVGYTAESLGELLSKEEAVESSPLGESTPVPEPQIFGSVLFAKVAPKREIKPFADEAPVIQEAPVIEPPTPIEAVRVFHAAPVVEEDLAIEAAPAIEPTPALESPAPAAIEPPSPSDPLPPVTEPVPPVRLVQRLPPLAMWARLQEAEENAPAGEGHPSNGNDDDPLGVLRIPPAIATVSYPTGCRIRRVTAKPVLSA